MPIPRRVARWNKAGLNRVVKHIAPWMPGLGLVVHHGRRSGRQYQTPVNVFPTDEGFVIALTYGAESTDWVRNVLAAGGCELRTRGRAVRVDSPRVFHDETRRAIRPAGRQVLKLIGVADFLSLRTVSLRFPDMETIAVIGAGIVGRTLAAAWVKAGHQVAIGSRDPESATVPAGAAVSEPFAALEEARVAVYTVPGSAMPEVLAAHTVALAGRIVIDATNNMAGSELSALRHLPDGAIGFRAFNSVGWENMDNPVIGGEVADMFFAGPDGAEREVVGGLISDVGFRPVYAGGSPAAFAAVDSVAGLWFALALGRGLGRHLAFRVLTDTGDA